MDKDRRKEQSRADKEKNITNMNRNLHGEKGVEGLTGRFRGTMYIKGTAYARKAIIFPLEWYKQRK